jgi:LuxR family maltose regulon positive regulatory protein
VAGQHVAARDALGSALPLGRKLGAFGTLVPRPAGLSALAADALRAGIEPEYVTALIARRGLPATSECSGVAAWPWAVRVRVLGGLSLEIASGKTATFGRSKMPPRLLAAIVGLSGRGRSVAAERIVEALWPEADGDQGMHAFEVTLMRLRKALGTAGRNAVRLESGRVWLDEASCFTDVDALDALCATIEEPGEPGASALDALSSELLALYTGPLLADSDLPPALIACRERIRRRVGSAVRTLGERLRAANRVREAQRLHERALAADDRLRAHLASFNGAPSGRHLSSGD